MLDPTNTLHGNADLATIHASLRTIARRELLRLGRDPNGADDVVQETWLTVLRQTDQDIRDLAVFARTTMRCRIRDLIRMERHGEELTDTHLAGDSTDVEDSARLEWLRAEIGARPERTRRILTEVLLEGRTQKQVASELGVTPQLVNRTVLTEVKRLQDRAAASEWRPRQSQCVA